MTSIVQLKEQVEQQFAVLRGDLVTLGQTAEAQANEILGVRAELGNLRGEVGTILTKVNADFMTLSDALQLRQQASVEAMNEAVNQVRITFVDQQGKLDVHHATLVEEHNRYEVMQNDLRELYKRTEASVVELQTGLRALDARVGHDEDGRGGGTC